MASPVGDGSVPAGDTTTGTSRRAGGARRDQFLSALADTPTALATVCQLAPGVCRRARGPARPRESASFDRAARVRRLPRAPHERSRLAHVVACLPVTRDGDIAPDGLQRARTSDRSRTGGQPF